MSAPEEQTDGRESKFSAYSNYRNVTGAVASAIDEAGDAYAFAAARKAENKSLQSRDAIRLRRYIKKAAMMLLPELRANADADEVYEKILQRWEEDGAAGEVAPDGGDEWPPFLRGIEEVNLRGPQQMPPWVEQFVRDIRRAGWEIGHLQAGEKTESHSGDHIEDQVDKMLKG